MRSIFFHKIVYSKDNLSMHNLYNIIKYKHGGSLSCQNFNIMHARVIDEIHEGANFASMSIVQVKCIDCVIQEDKINTESLTSVRLA